MIHLAAAATATATDDDDSNYHDADHHDEVNDDDHDNNIEDVISMALPKMSMNGGGTKMTMITTTP